MMPVVAEPPAQRHVESPFFDTRSLSTIEASLQTALGFRSELLRICDADG
jgi:hypothetical protein